VHVRPSEPRLDAGGTGRSTQAQIVTALSPGSATPYNQGTIIGVAGLNAGQRRTIVQLTAASRRC